MRKISFLDFLAMGVKHIWAGYDHLLFLFGLMIVTRNFKASIKIIACFTIAHSITLAIATLNPVQISSGIAEPLIAASIVYVGLENPFRGGKAPLINKGIKSGFSERLNHVVPFAMKSVAVNVNHLHLLVGHLPPSRIFPTV